MIQEDTISAIATALGNAGVGIIRMSGIDSIKIADKIFRAANKKKLSTAKDRSIIFGHVVDNNESIIDEAIILIMRSPHSYTKEDIVELQCHGGRLVLNKVLMRTLEAGARLAERGEFTKRAFLNGRLDLSQAQAVLDIIQARTETALKMAEKKLSGMTFDKIHNLRQMILHLTAHIEAVIDFPEDDIDDVILNEISDDLEKAIVEINTIIKDETESKILNEGIEIAIIGKPNVGKSSLLNLLLNKDRAIITDIPGTTRDSIEDYINIKGIPIKIIDTAGIRQSNDKIEQIGIEHTKEYINQAALILVLFDGSNELTVEDQEIINLLHNRNVIALITKKDLYQNIDLTLIKKFFINSKIVNISMKTNEGIDILKQAIVDNINKISNSLDFVRNAKELDLMRKIKKNLEDAKETLKLNTEIDLVAIDLHSALHLLDELTGESINEDLINEIFSKFCIGK